MATTRGRLLHEPKRRRQIELPPPPDLDLDAPCGRYFRYRDLIECGETWHGVAELHRRDPAHHARPDNIPRQPETYVAMCQLCEEILDPLRDQFGPVLLTYAFASPGLTRHIVRGIAPHLDQHAGHERSPAGERICPRGGLASDVAVVGIPATHLRDWLRNATKFDRIYYYGDVRPVHVSVATERTGSVFDMTQGVPRRL